MSKPTEGPVNEDAKLLEELIGEALRRKGLLFPITEEQVEAFEEKLKECDIVLPDSLKEAPIRLIETEEE